MEHTSKEARATPLAPVAFRYQHQSMGSRPRLAPLVSFRLGRAWACSPLRRSGAGPRASRRARSNLHEVFHERRWPSSGSGLRTKGDALLRRLARHSRTWGHA